MTRNKNVTEEPRLEVTETVHPHAGRALLWPSCHTAQFRPPCINYLYDMRAMHIWMTTVPKEDAGEQKC